MPPPDLNAPLPQNRYRFCDLAPPPVLQFWAAAAWWTSRGGSLSPAGTPAPVLAAGALLLTIGQTLNVAVYRALGGDGVYYGARLGRVVPWVHGFPFTLGGKGRARRGGVRIPHPQYLGSAATAWGLFLLFSANAPAGGAVLIAYWTALYVVTGVQEDYL